MDVAARSLHDPEGGIRVAGRGRHSRPFRDLREQILTLAGLTPERLQELTQRAVAWALPNVTLGALVIVPIWFLAFLFRPPRRSND